MHLCTCYCSAPPCRVKSLLQAVKTMPCQAKPWPLSGPFPVNSLPRAIKIMPYALLAKVTGHGSGTAGWQRSVCLLPPPSPPLCLVWLQSSIANELACEKVLIQGLDKASRPVLIVQVRLRMLRARARLSCTCAVARVSRM